MFLPNITRVGVTTSRSIGGLTRFGPPNTLLFRDYSLRAYTPVKLNESPLGILSNAAFEWKRSKTFVGSDLIGTFTLMGPIDILEHWFYDLLGAHIEEHSFGQQTWEGFIWEMDLAAPGHTRSPARRWKRRRRSYETLFNRVRCDYTDPDTGITGSTAWVSDSASIARYGQKEEIIQRDLNATNALEAANEYLETFAFAPPLLISFDAPSEAAFLEVTVVGYWATAAFRFTATADGSTSDVGSWVDDIFTTDLEFLTNRKVASNSRAIVQELSTPTRANQVLEDLLTLRKPISGDRYNIEVWNEREIVYLDFPNDPIGKLSNGELQTLGGATLEQTPRVIEPGIYRDMDYQAGVFQQVPGSNSYFATPADILIETIEVDAEGLVIPRLGVYSDEEALRTFAFSTAEAEEKFGGNI